MDKDVRLSIASEIYAQLGGRAFTVITGCRPYSIGENKDGELEFTLKIGRNKSAANRMRITYKEGEDLYEVLFYRILNRNGIIDCKEIELFSGVYCGQLVSIFCTVTGLVAKFPKFVTQ